MNRHRGYASFVLSGLLVLSGCSTNDTRLVVSGSHRGSGVTDQQYARVVATCTRVAQKNGLAEERRSNLAHGATAFAKRMRFGNFVGPYIYVAPRELAADALVVVSGEGSNTPGQDRDRLSQALARELIREFGSAHVRVEPYHWTEW